jgi:hypothetical protein
MRPIAIRLTRLAVRGIPKPLSRNAEPHLELGKGEAGSAELADLANLLPGELGAVRFARHPHNASSESLVAPFPTTGHRAGGQYLR